MASNKLKVRSGTNEVVEIRVTGPSGGGKQEIIDYISDSFREAGNVVSDAREDSPRELVPSESFSVLRKAGAGKSWGLKELSRVEIPAHLMSQELVDVLAKQGLMARVERDQMLDDFIEVMKNNAEIGEGWGLSLEVDGGSFKSADTHLAFAGFKFGRAMQ